MEEEENDLHKATQGSVHRTYHDCSRHHTHLQVLPHEGLNMIYEIWKKENQLSLNTTRELEASVFIRRRIRILYEKKKNKEGKEPKAYCSLVIGANSFIFVFVLWRWGVGDWCSSNFKIFCSSFSEHFVTFGPIQNLLMSKWASQILMV